ncbi:hypothetical protein [Streptomyces sp. CC210A]|uniref:hypothetical protein n=1 Tax=Streptomyces sp. CC210A TaxID=2898184 RepID=UPI001F4362C0|nr:hypothetical protein [Streptomyces sp. CC210A]
MSTALDARTLLSEHFPNVVATVLDSNPGMQQDLAERITEEGIKFVVTCARTPGVDLAPSRIVDEGWHALLLHSAPYAELCARFGSMVHHYPGYDPTYYDHEILDRTRASIRAAGFDVDEELWAAPGDERLVAVAAQCQHAPSCAIRPMPKPEWP